MIDLDYNPEENYRFTDGDLSNFQHELSAPKQDMGITEDPEAGFKEESTGLVDDEPSVIQDCRTMAKGFTIAIDTPVSALFSLFNEGDASPFRFTKEERKSVEDAMACYLKMVGAQIPPGLMLAIVLVTIYAGKTTLLIKLRKERKRQNELQKKIDSLSASLAEANGKLKTIENGKNSKTEAGN